MEKGSSAAVAQGIRDAVDDGAKTRIWALVDPLCPIKTSNFLNALNMQPVKMSWLLLQQEIVGDILLAIIQITANAVGVVMQINIYPHQVHMPSVLPDWPPQNERASYSNMVQPLMLPLQEEIQQVDLHHVHQTVKIVFIHMEPHIIMSDCWHRKRILFNCWNKHGSSTCYRTCRIDSCC